MKTTNAMQLKAKIKAEAARVGVSAQSMMQCYLLERLLERISLTPWRERMVIKGGVLISSLIGVGSRTTKDLDTTVRGFSLSHESAERAFREICLVEVDDDIRFEYVRTEDIRDADEYPGIRVFLVAHYSPMAVPLTVDVTAGDRITPDAVTYRYPLLFEERSVTIMAYPIETVLSEKLETVIVRDVANTRPRDYYDIYMLWKLQRDRCDLRTLAAALKATSERRGSLSVLNGYRSVMSRVADDQGMDKLWSGYQSGNPYARSVSLRQACETVLEIMEAVDPVSIKRDVALWRRGLRDR